MGRTKILTLAAAEMNHGDALGDVGQMEDKWCKSPHVGEEVRIASSQTETGLMVTKGWGRSEEESNV